MNACAAPRSVAVVVTVLNEGQSIGALMDSLAAQTRVPDEVIVVDGGSSDDTVAVLRSHSSRLPLQVAVEPGVNISQGRNRGIELGLAEIIATTDAGVRLAPDWLEELTRPFASPVAAPQVVSGAFVADPQTLFETAMGATVLVAMEDVDPASFLPSSRSFAFTRQAWRAVGGYPDWLDYCEDLVFDLLLRERCGPFGWAPRAVVYFRPRRTLAAFFRQYYRYARGDGKADLWRKRHAVRYATYLLLLPGILVLAAWSHPAWLIAGLVGLVGHCWTPWRRLAGTWGRYAWPDRLRAAALVPVIRVVGDVAKMIGYPAGWRWRISNWHSPEIHWR